MTCFHNLIVCFYAELWNSYQIYIFVDFTRNMASPTKTHKYRNKSLQEGNQKPVATSFYYVVREISEDDINLVLRQTSYCRDLINTEHEERMLQHEKAC